MNARDTQHPTIEKEPAKGGALLPVTLAVADYDRTRAIIDGRVHAEGVALKVNSAWIGDFCIRPVYEEYDVAEMSLSWYVAARCRGEPVIALPVFPLRMPVLAYLFCASDAPYTKPADLIGKRIGCPGYRYTVNLWTRGIMQDHYGVSPEQLKWVTGEKEGAGYVVPPGIDVTIREGANPEDLLASGEVDAILLPVLPESFLRGDPDIRRLFPDAKKEMQSYVRASGIFPITHTVVMRQSLAEREPWLAASMTRLFREAQDKWETFANADPKHLMFPDAVFFLEEQRAAYGAHPWVQGLSPNRKVIETFVRYANEQGYIARRPSLEELFVKDAMSM